MAKYYTMKTSNKILTGFLVLIFLVPLLVLLSFKSKIRNGEFTTVNSQAFHSPYSRNGSFNPYKTVKVIGQAGNEFTVNIHRADTMSYNYHLYNNDSVKVYNDGDILMIRLAGSPRESGDERDEINLDLKLPSLEHLIVENAEANVFFADSAKNMEAEIYGSGRLNFGDKRDNQGPSVAGKPAIRLPQLSIKSSGADLAIGQNLNVGLLKIETAGAATITIREGAVIDNIQGQLSDSSSVNANWKYVKKLQSTSGQ